LRHRLRLLTTLRKVAVEFDEISVLIIGEAAKTHKDTDNFLVTVGQSG
jgi:hypothetical protein